MSKTLSALEAKDMHIASLRFVILILGVLCVGLWYGWQKSPKDLWITLPPDTRYGTTIRPGEYDLATVYGFAKLTFSAFNRWVEDGQKEYPALIEEYQSLFTPKFLNEVKEHMRKKMGDGELNGRSRYLLDVPGFETYKDEHVRILDDGSWIVFLRYEVIENMSTMQIKRVTYEYPLHIVRMNIDPKKNAYGLAINGIAPGYKEKKID